MEWFGPRSSPPSPPEFGSIHPAEHEPHHVIINSSRFSLPAMRLCLGKGSYPQGSSDKGDRRVVWKPYQWHASGKLSRRKRRGAEIHFAGRFEEPRHCCRAQASGARVSRGWLGGLGRILPEQEPHGAADVQLLISIPHPQVNLFFPDFLSRNIFHAHHFPFCLCV